MYWVLGRGKFWVKFLTSNIIFEYLVWSFDHFEVLARLRMEFRATWHDGITEREDNNNGREDKVNSLRSAENAAQSTFIRY